MTPAQAFLLSELKQGRAVDCYREGGNSMLPIIKSRQPVRVEPVGDRKLKKGDIVFVKIGGRYVLHRIWGFQHKDTSVQIGNNSGYINGWTSVANVYGIMTQVHPMNYRGVKK